MRKAQKATAAAAAAAQKSPTVGSSAQGAAAGPSLDVQSPGIVPGRVSLELEQADRDFVVSCKCKTKRSGYMPRSCRADHDFTLKLLQADGKKKRGKGKTTQQHLVVKYKSLTQKEARLTSLVKGLFQWS